MGNNTKHATTMGAVRGVVHTNIKSNTAIVGSERKTATIGRINEAKGLTYAATTTQIAAIANDVKRAITVLKIVQPRAFQKKGKVNRLKNCAIDCANGGMRYSFLTVAATIIHVSHINTRAVIEAMILSFLAVKNFFITL